MPSRPSATRQPRFTISVTGAMPERKLQIGTGVDRDGDAALSQQFKLVRPRPGAMGERQSRGQEADLVEKLTMPSGVGIEPGALVLVSSRCIWMRRPVRAEALRSPQAAVRAPLYGLRTILHVEQRAGRGVRDRIDQLDLFLTESGVRMKRRRTSSRACGDSAASTGSDGP